MALRLSNINELNKLFQAVADAVREALQSLRKNLELLSLYVEKIEPEAAISFSPVHETIINQLEEIARIAGSSCIAEGEDRGSTFTGSVITSYQGSLFIVAPAGFGKTSFCRWNALNDLEKLLDFVTGNVLAVVEGIINRIGMLRSAPVLRVVLNRQCLVRR